MSVGEADFTILEPIGQGSYSSVYHATDRRGRHFALKRLFWNNSPERITKELERGAMFNHPNIARVYAAYRTSDQVTFVLEYVPHVSFRNILSKLNQGLMKSYIYQLLSALAHLHSKKIIHRDIKPANFLFDPAANRGCLIDFGLCEKDTSVPGRLNVKMGDIADDADLLSPELFQKREKMIANKSGTRGFRAPEVLFNSNNQSCLIDVWSAGVILLSMLTKRYPFFKSSNECVALCEFACIVGTKRLREAAYECGRKVRFPKEIEPVKLRSLVERLNPSIVEEKIEKSVYDLLDKMLEPCPSKRISAADALKHQYFTTVLINQTIG